VTGPRLTPERRLGLVGQQADEWTARTSEVPVIDTGSALAQDDAVFPPYPLSQQIWMGLSSGAGHLDLFMAALKATRTARPFGYLTLARAGLVGAAHALWLLDEDPNERRRRGVRMAHEDYKHELAALNTLNTVMPNMRQRTDQQIARVREQIRQVTDSGRSLGMTPETVTQRLNDTEIIRGVARRFAGGQDHESDLIAAYVLSWSRHSGQAHGMRWSAMIGANVMRDDEGRPYARVTTGVDDLAMAAGAVHMLLVEGFALFDRYRTSNEPAA
jgi:hypothetical protein